MKISILWRFTEIIAGNKSTFIPLNSLTIRSEIWYYVSLCIQSRYGKMWTRITPNIDTFYAVSVDLEGLNLYNKIGLSFN